MINKHKSNKIKENSNTVRHLNNGTDHRHSKSCCDQSSPARRTIMWWKVGWFNKPKVWGSINCLPLIRYMCIIPPHATTPATRVSRMTSSNRNIFRVTGNLCGEFIGHRWRGALMFSLICAWINGWVNNRATGDMRRHRAHYVATLMSAFVALLGNTKLT